MAQKTGMSKACGHVEWDFLEANLGQMGFNLYWIQLFMQYVTTMSCIIVLNGDRGTSFCPSKGLRQSNSLSPYLFIMMVELFKMCIKMASQALFNVFFFADNSLFYIYTSVVECNHLRQCLSLYVKVSGPRINFWKSNVYVNANTHVKLQDIIAHSFESP